MKGVHLFPQEEKQQGLNAPPGRAEIVETDYDPVINMTFAEYENNLQDNEERLPFQTDSLLQCLYPYPCISAWSPHLLSHRRFFLPNQRIPRSFRMR